MRLLLVTGSSGLVGSVVCEYFHSLGWAVHGIDNNTRRALFGPDGDTRTNQRRLQETLAAFTHHELDIRDRSGVMALFGRLKPAAVVHAAAQPSHDRAAALPFDDFEINAGGTLNLLEAARAACPDSPFVFMSTNKVYGDAPNHVPLRETPTRWEYADPRMAGGIAEDFPLDQCMHSLFGVSKVAADLMVQEYGRYFGLPTCCLRGGCITGPWQSGVELHGFLNYLVKVNVEERPYTIIGYWGKQVRDHIHARDVARFIAEFIAAPRPAAVYNMGGGRGNACSVIEAIAMVEAATGQPLVHSYVDQPRLGDHVCYYTDLAKAVRDYPGWQIQHRLPAIIQDIAQRWRQPEAAPLVPGVS